MEESWTERNFLNTYIISGIIISLVAAFIHKLQYNPTNWNLFFLWLPVVWGILFLFAIGLYFFIREDFK